MLNTRKLHVRFIGCCTVIQLNSSCCRSGFATEQGAYQDAQADLEKGLAEVEARLSSSRFLMGDNFTDADLRLLPTVVRYDAVYNSLFRYVLMPTFFLWHYK